MGSNVSPQKQSASNVRKRLEESLNPDGMDSKGLFVYDYPLSSICKVFQFLLSLHLELKVKGSRPFSRTILEVEARIVRAHPVKAFF